MPQRQTPCGARSGGYDPSNSMSMSPEYEGRLSRDIRKDIINLREQLDKLQKDFREHRDQSLETWRYLGQKINHVLRIVGDAKDMTSVPGRQGSQDAVP